MGNNTFPRRRWLLLLGVILIAATGGGLYLAGVWRQASNGVPAGTTVFIPIAPEPPAAFQRPEPAAVDPTVPSPPPPALLPAPAAPAPVQPPEGVVASPPAPAIPVTPRRTGPAALAGIPGGLTLPIYCQLGETCWVLNYFDVDKSETARDFQCRSRSYDGHTGTDFAVRDLTDVQRGISVIASADGLVRGARDGEAEGVYMEKGKEATANKECGNGVLLEHGEGWQTQYCHMRRGSISVKIGDRVKRGDHLGMVGMSGATEFPHVHLEVRKNGVSLDPFTGRASEPGCTTDAEGRSPLWSPAAKIAYEDLVVYAAGFHSEAPTPAMLDRNSRGNTTLRADGRQIIFWGSIFGVEAGDRLNLRIFKPDGTGLAEANSIAEKNMARWTRSMTLSRTVTAPWQPGRYRGVVTIERARGIDGSPARRTRETAVEIR